METSPSSDESKVIRKKVGLGVWLHTWNQAHKVSELVGGWTNPSEKYARQIGFIFPNFRGEHDKSLSCHQLVSEGMDHFPNFRGKNTKMSETTTLDQNRMEKK